MSKFVIEPNKIYPVIDNSCVIGLVSDEEDNDDEEA